jgi:hypothetical protein
MSYRNAIDVAFIAGIGAATLAAAARAAAAAA